MKKIRRRIQKLVTQRTKMKLIEQMSSDDIATYNKNFKIKEFLKELEELQTQSAKYVDIFVNSKLRIQVDTKDTKQYYKSPINRHDLREFNKLYMQDDLKKHLAIYKHYYPQISKFQNTYPNLDVPHNPITHLNRDMPENNPDQL